MQILLQAGESETSVSPLETTGKKLFLKYDLLISL